MKPMTDRELNDLFRKHLPLRGSMPSAMNEFVGSAYYDFARELEHRALVTGMMIGGGQQERGGGSRLRALLSWLWGG